MGRPQKHKVGDRVGTRVIIAEAGRNDIGVRLVQSRCDCGAVAVTVAMALRTSPNGCHQCAINRRKPKAPKSPVEPKPPKPPKGPRGRPRIHPPKPPRTSFQCWKRGDVFVLALDEWLRWKRSGGDIQALK